MCYVQWKHCRFVGWCVICREIDGLKSSGLRNNMSLDQQCFISFFFIFFFIYFWLDFVQLKAFIVYDLVYNLQWELLVNKKLEKVRFRDSRVSRASKIQDSRRYENSSSISDIHCQSNMKRSTKLCQLIKYAIDFFFLVMMLQIYGL